MEFWTAATAVSTFALFVVTIFAVRVAKRSFRQARDDAMDRHRPLLSARLQNSERGKGSIDLVLINVGQSTAVDVAVTIPEDDTAPGEVILTQLFLRHELTIAPGQILKFPWTNRDGKAEHILGGVLEIPGRGYTGKNKVELKYAGVHQPEVQYQESYLLDSVLHELWDFRALQSSDEDLTSTP